MKASELVQKIEYLDEQIQRERDITGLSANVEIRIGDGVVPVTEVVYEFDRRTGAKLVVIK